MEAKGLPRARVLEMELVDTHGDPYYAGLSALRVLAANDSSGEVEDFPLSASMLSASPKDINVVSQRKRPVPRGVCAVSRAIALPGCPLLCLARACSLCCCCGA